MSTHLDAPGQHLTTTTTTTTNPLRYYCPIAEDLGYQPGYE